MNKLQLNPKRNHKKAVIRHYLGQNGMSQINITHPRSFYSKFRNRDKAYYELLEYDFITSNVVRLGCILSFESHHVPHA